MEFRHYSVMLEETIEQLKIRPDGIYVDGTLGGGGHAFEVCRRLSEKGHFYGIDQDEAAIKAAGERLAEFKDKVTIIRSNYCHMKEELKNREVGQVDGILLDLGVSSYQLDEVERGFTYREDVPLDMRMDTEQKLDACAVVNEYPLNELTRIFREYGEEKNAYPIAKDIVSEREKKRIETTGELVKIIERHYPASPACRSGHPAKRVFQAIRIEVNGELDGLSEAIEDGAKMLVKGGRIAIITFHSLEDRIVKNAFRELEKDCVCPKNFPVCVCGKRKEIEILTKKPITASEEELRSNPRAASAKLRIAERV